MMNTSNNKYKTAMCKHFETTGECKMGQRCHFAHGPQELRAANDPVPQSFNQGNNGIRKPRTGPMGQGQGFQNNTGGGNNYKTVQCKYFEKGSCKFENNCTFAHGDVDVRQGGGGNGQQGGARPMRSGHPTGANASATGGESIQNQVAQAQIQTLGTKLEAYHGLDQDILPAIKQANGLVKEGNIQEAASILYGIMNRQEKREGDMTNYQKFQAEIQSLGNQLYEQYQSQMYTQGTAGQGSYGQSGYGQQAGGYNNYSQGGSYQQGFGGNYGGQDHYGGQGGYGGQQYGAGAGAGAGEQGYAHTAGAQSYGGAQQHQQQYHH